MVPRSREHLTAVMNHSNHKEYLVDLQQNPGSNTKQGWILQDGLILFYVQFK